LAVTGRGHHACDPASPAGYVGVALYPRSGGFVSYGASTESAPTQPTTSIKSSRAPSLDLPVERPTVRLVNLKTAQTQADRPPTLLFQAAT
jgi:hypothetical protein